MSMSDFLSSDNNRADMVEKLKQFCDAQNLSYEYSVSDFTVKLPGSEPIPLTDRIITKRRRSYDTDTWGPISFHEEDPDDPNNFKITEGEA